GITWPARPWLRGHFSFVPTGSVFSHTGMMVFSPDQNRVSDCSLLNSDCYVGLLHLLMARGMGADTDQTLKYEAGYLSSVPIPTIDSQQKQALESLAFECYGHVRSGDLVRETSHFFVAPSAVQSKRSGLLRSFQQWVANTAELRKKI